MQTSVTVNVRVPEAPFPAVTAAVLCDRGIGWELADWDLANRDLANRDLANRDLADLEDLTGNVRAIALGASAECAEQNILEIADRLEAAGAVVKWRAAASVVPVASAVPVTSEQAMNGMDDTRPAYRWPNRPTVLAVIPHWQCEQWLRRCLQSLVSQRYPLTNIVVIDDGSETAPIEIVRDFPQVTLLASTLAQQVGPYRLVQSVAERVNYTAFLFQDADDWSSCDRLQTLLTTARLHQADLVGSQEIRVMEPAQTLQAVGYPIDVNAAMRYAPGHGLLHPTSLVTRQLLQRVGGFATGLRFGADSEFLLRAHWIARVVNSPNYCYFRRKRPDSLTTSKETGLASQARKQLTQTMKVKARERSQAVQAGKPPDLRPLAVESLVELAHVCGPTLRWQ
ncbi:MAG: glycosyltransferase family 2 protein [Phormidesmis sp.]